MRLPATSFLLRCTSFPMSVTVFSCGLSWGCKRCGCKRCGGVRSREFVLFTQSVSFLPRDIVLHVSQVHDEECFGRVFPTLLARVFVVYTLGN